MSLRGFRFSSARRPRRRARGVLVAAGIAGGAAIVALLVLGRGSQTSPAPDPSPTATATRSPSPAPPEASPTATPFPEIVSSDWEEVSAASPTATPLLGLPPAASPTPRPTATPEPGLSACVEVDWTASEMHSRFGQALVDIEIVNHCSRDLAPTDLYFRVAGYRNGGLVQEVRAHPLETIYRDHVGRVTVGLPGSLSWYDRVEVEMREAGR